MEKVELYFDGILRECTVTIDRNGEYLCESEDGRFAKFPADADLEEAVERHNEANNKDVTIIPDVEYGEVEHYDENGNLIN